MLSFSDLAQKHNSFFTTETNRINAALAPHQQDLKAAGEALRGLRAAHVSSLNSFVGSGSFASAHATPPTQSAPAQSAPAQSAPIQIETGTSKPRENPWIAQMKGDLIGSLYGADGQGTSHGSSHPTPASGPGESGGSPPPKRSGKTGFQFAEWANPSTAEASTGAGASSRANPAGSFSGAKSPLLGLYGDISGRMQSYLS